jgi:hypothetical protein
MALEPIQLDTLNWDQVVTAIRARIVPDSGGKWTLHAPVDPGITMIELFAWLLEQRIYWMSQVPDSLSLAALSLLGVAPQAAQAAVTVFQLSDAAPTPRPLPLAAAGMLLQLQDSNPPLSFTTDDALAILPVQSSDAIRITVDSIAHSLDLQQGRLVPLLATGESSAQIGITLSLNTPLAAVQPGQSFSLMVELQTPADVFAEWTSKAVQGVAAPATLTWSYRSAPSGATVAFPSASIHDGTAGLRRSGIVRLPLPSDWQAEQSSGGTAAYTILLQIQDANFTTVPLLRRLIPNAVLGHHRWIRRKNPPTNAWLPLPGNVVSLVNTSGDSDIEEYPPIEDSVRLEIREQGGQPQQWQRAITLSLSGPTDRVFLVDRSRSEISFGDGLTGHLPVIDPADPSALTVTYAAGGGAGGNNGEGQSWSAQPNKSSDPFPMFTAVNRTPGDGGADAETIAMAQQRAGEAFNDRTRAVSKVDYENLVITTPGVAFRRAYAAIGYHPDFPFMTVPGVVTMFGVPYAPRVQKDGDWASAAFVPAPKPDPGALQAAQTRLTSGKLIGGDVIVLGPVYRPVWLGLTIAVSTPLTPSLREQIIAGLQTFLDPLVGGDDLRGWPFGDPLRPSALARVAQDILGRAGDVQSVSILIDCATAAESCNDVAINPHELVTLVHVDIRTQRRSAQSGGLR